MSQKSDTNQAYRSRLSVYERVQSFPPSVLCDLSLGGTRSGIRLKIIGIYASTHMPVTIPTAGMNHQLWLI